MKSDMPLIECKNITKMYDDATILENISFTVHQGEFISIIGKSGCGKTTLLKMINALLLPDEGEVLVYGENTKTTDKIALRRKIGYVIQNAGLFPHMTVKRNIEYVPRLYKKRERKQVDIEQLLEIVSLDFSFINRFPSSLSGGQKQRVGIARALASSPKLLLMDEPFGAVDEITRKELRKSILHIQKELGITILFVTHSIEEALALGSKTMILGEKKILAFESSEEVVKNRTHSDYIQALLADIRMKTPSSV